MLADDIKHCILTWKRSHEMHEVINHPLKRILNREILTLWHCAQRNSNGTRFTAYQKHIV